MLLLVLAPALAIVTGAEALPHGARNVHPNARSDITTTGPAGRQRTAPGPAAAAPRPTAPLTRTDGGMRLLREAAAASKTFPYQGVQIVSWWSPAGTITTVVNVAHEPGQGTVLRTADTSASPADESFIADQPGAQPGAVLGVTEETLNLLAANYQVTAAGSGSACGRSAAVVEARRADGSLAARFWLDDATKIPLRRELFDGASRMINENTFIDLDLGRRAAAESMLLQAAPAARPWNVLTTADLNRLRATGWPLPARLPDGLTLFSARQAATPAGPVFQLGYSDGLSGLSLFVQHGGLPGGIAGWRETRIGPWPVYTRGPVGQGLAWSSHGHVLTLIADAPAVTISAVVRALPHDGGRGFWARVCHGFGRLVSWVNPFR